MRDIKVIFLAAAMATGSALAGFSSGHTQNNPIGQSSPAASNPSGQLNNVTRTIATGRGEGGPRQQNTGFGGISNPAFSTLNDAGTRDIQQRITVANEICSWFPVEVRIDCVADRFREIARSIPSTGEYAPVREALEAAAEDLRTISGRYAAVGAPAQRFQAPHPLDGAPVRTSRLTSITPDLQSRAIEEALEVVEELETTLLRSAENSRKRQLHFQEISASIGSTKVLLRSA